MSIQATEFQHYLLTCLMEECGEVIQICAKMKRFGINDFHPKSGNIHNYRLLNNELNDVIAIVQMLQDTGIDFSMLFDDEALDRKKEKVLKYKEMYERQDNERQQRVRT